MRERREREAQRPREDTEVRGPEARLSKDQPEASGAAERERVVGNGIWGQRGVGFNSEHSGKSRRISKGRSTMFSRNGCGRSVRAGLREQEDMGPLGGARWHCYHCHVMGGAEA